MAPEEEVSGEKQIALRSELTSLSGKHGNTKRRTDGTLISNDGGYINISPQLKERLAAKKGGVSLVIGSGGLLSMLPDLNSDINLVVDMNPAVLEVTQAIAELISQCETPEDVLAKFTDPETRDKYKILAELFDSTVNKKLSEKPILIHYLELKIKKEARIYGRDHWTNPERFQQIKRVLEENSPLYLAANITNPDFRKELKDVLNKYGQNFNFINLSNVHAWIHEPMDFIKDWLSDGNPTIIFSSALSSLVGDYPQFEIAKSLDSYLQTAQKDSQKAQ